VEADEVYVVAGHKGHPEIVRKLGRKGRRRRLKGVRGRGTLEGFWSLLRSWLGPHRGISQEKLPLYLGFFEFVHNVRQRGKALLASLLTILLAP
jgi:transposase-like protein